MIIVDIYRKFLECGVVTTDSRAIKGGEMFFALKGENFDGNEYALKALEAGAAYAVVNVAGPAGGSDDPRLIKVEDTLKTLQELARWHRSMTIVDGKPLTVIALTGTNGKTTTKELIREVLSVKYKVTATEGNLNNSIGVPLTLLKIDSETELAVVEMGASHPGDIKELVDIALPNYGLITNVGKAHLLGFGSFEGVKATKGELYDYLRRTADKAFINVDNPHLCQMASERNMQHDTERSYSLLLPYGLDYQGFKVLPSDAEHPYLRISAGTSVINTNLVGSYNADNVMAALAVFMAAPHCRTTRRSKKMAYSLKPENAKRLAHAVTLMRQISTNSSEPRVWRTDSEYLMVWLSSMLNYGSEISTEGKERCYRLLEEWMDEHPSEIEVIQDPTQEPLG